MYIRTVITISKFSHKAFKSPVFPQY